MTQFKFKIDLFNIVQTYSMYMNKAITLNKGEYVIVMTTNSKKDIDVKISTTFIKDEFEIVIWARSVTCAVINHSFTQQQQHNLKV